MNYFSIKDLENLTGIKAHTLRVWEQRYGIVVAQRKESNHRFYDNEDLKKVLRIAYLYHQGYKISKIALLDANQIKTLAINNEKGNAVDILVNTLLEASIDFDETQFETSLDFSFKQFGFEKTILQVIYPYLEKIGIFWMIDNIIPAQEHFSSNIIRHKIIAATEKIAKPLNTSKKQVVLFTPLGEYHEIPLLITNYLMKKAGHQTIYFGCNIAITAIENYLQHAKATHIYTHLITLFNDKGIDDFIAGLCNQFKNMTIVISGPAAQQASLQKTNLHIMRSFQDTVAFTKAID